MIDSNESGGQDIVNCNNYGDVNDYGGWYIVDGKKIWYMVQGGQ